jgi:hypothetical protein
MLVLLIISAHHNVIQLQACYYNYTINGHLIDDIKYVPLYVWDWQCYLTTDSDHLCVELSYGLMRYILMHILICIDTTHIWTYCTYPSPFHRPREISKSVNKQFALAKSHILSMAAEKGVDISIQIARAKIHDQIERVHY